MELGGVDNKVCPIYIHIYFSYFLFSSAAGKFRAHFIQHHRQYSYHKAELPHILGGHESA